ncbi:hypothetical protein ACIQI8_13190 [Streptomyces sp. NPDC092369]|uniref:hypothetical protein n=1 Tax=Streptomyces sp. NPDC092369 TaxID=3366015 RepID=UPI0038021576
MRRIPASAGLFARSSRGRRLPLVMTAAAVLSLAACGTEKAGAGGERSKSAVAVGAGGRTDAAFTAMLDRVARSCPPSAPPEAPPTGPASTPPSGSVAADVEPVAPTAGPEVELNARDWCASARHEERVAQALRNLADPTPAEVRKVLNGLGYVDERIHDLKRSGATTRFFLDLRRTGGRLCLRGSAAGERTVIDTCVAPATGPFTPGGQRG